MERQPALDVIRCLMNYMIVVLHAWAAFQYVAWDTIEFKFWTFVCSHLCWLAIPCFFLISGYFLFQSYSLVAWPEKMKRRIRRLVVPYVSWNLLFVLFYLMMGSLVPRLALRIETFGLNTFGGAISKIVSLTVPPIDGPLWFLRVIFLLACLSPILYGVMRLRGGAVAFAIALAWAVMEPLTGFGDHLRLTAPAYAIACFVGGGVLSLRGKDLLSVFRSCAWLWMGLVACATRAIFLVPLSVSTESLSPAQSSLMSVLAVAEAPALLSLVSRFPIKRIVNRRIFRFFSGMSFFAYAGHFLFCSMVLHSLAPVCGALGLGKMTLLILAFVFLGTGLMAAVYCLAKRFVPKFLRVFDGTLWLT